MELYKSILNGIPYFENRDIALESSGIFGSLMNVYNKLVKRTVKSLVGNKNDPIIKDISKSGGDLKKCSFYKDSKTCMDALEMMSRRGGGGKKFIENLVTIHDWMITHTKDLKGIAKRTTNHVGNQFYLAIVMLWAYGVSVGIATCTSIGSTGIIIWEKQDKVSKTKFGKMVSKMAACARSGKLDDAIKRISSDRNASESGLAFAAVVAVGGAILLLYFVRYIIMRFFELRGGIADWLRNQSYFVKMISNNNKGITEEQRASQQKDSETLEKLAEKIDVDLKEEDDIPESSDVFNRETEAVVAEAQKPAPSQVESFMGQENPPETNSAPSEPVSGLNF
jgi:hypothetical protein